MERLAKRRAEKAAREASGEAASPNVIKEENSGNDSDGSKKSNKS